jgi:hypothetical protein
MSYEVRCMQGVNKFLCIAVVESRDFTFTVNRINKNSSQYIEEANIRINKNSSQ